MCSWSPSSIGKKMRLNWGPCSRDGSVFGVHLPGVGALHTDPGEEKEGEEELGPCWGAVPRGQPQDLGTHRACASPACPALSWAELSQAGEPIPSLEPGWQQGGNLQDLPGRGSTEPRAGLCRHTSHAVTAGSRVMLRAWLEVSSGKADPLGGSTQRL